MLLDDPLQAPPAGDRRHGRAVAIAVTALALVVAVAAVAVATQLDVLVLALAGFTGVLMVALSLRWPMAPLFVLAATIPFDEAVRFGDLGTVGRSAALLFAVCYALPRLGRLTLRAMPGAAWGYVGWSLLSVGWALDQDVAIRELGTLLQLFALGFLIADVVVHRPAVVRPLLWCYTLAATVSALIAIYGYLSGQLTDGVRVAALPGQDPAQYAAVLLPALVFSVYELIDGRYLWLSAATTGITSIGVLLSGTRGAWLAAAVVAVIYILPHLRRRRRVAAAGALAGIVLIAALLPGVADFVGRRAETAISSGGAGRTDIWAVGLQIVGSAPLSGVGYANFPVAFTPEAVQAAELSSDTGLNRAPHNIVLSTMAELGPVGVALLALFLGGLLVRRGWGPDATVVQACLVALLVSALFLDIVDNRKQVWLILGVAAGLRYLAELEESGIRPADPRAWPAFARIRRFVHGGVDEGATPATMPARRP